MNKIKKLSSAYTFTMVKYKPCFMKLQIVAGQYLEEHQTYFAKQQFRIFRMTEYDLVSTLIYNETKYKGDNEYE